MITTTASRMRWVSGTIVALGVFAGCAGTPTVPAATGTSAGPGYGTPATSASPPAASAPGSATMVPAAALRLKMADTSLGSVLVDGRGMTLYLFTKDSPNTSACEGQCLVNWPPLLGVPLPGAGVDDARLGSFTRADGRTQATYNGWPLYYWVKDTAPGDTTGQNVQGVWFVLDRDGEPVK